MDAGKSDKPAITFLRRSSTGEFWRNLFRDPSKGKAKYEQGAPDLIQERHVPIHSNQVPRERTNGGLRAHNAYREGSDDISEGVNSQDLKQNKDVPIHSRKLTIGSGQSPSTIARSLFTGQCDSCPQEDQLSCTQFRTAIRESFMDYFNFKDRDILDALRQLCSRLKIAGEAQEIDRVLISFSRRWHACNPDSVFHTQESVYSVAFALILLNTDLHVVTGNQKMTKGQFVENTLLTVASSSEAKSSRHSGSGNLGDALDTPPLEDWENRAASELKAMYLEIQELPIQQPQADYDKDALYENPPQRNFSSLPRDLSRSSVRLARLVSPSKYVRQLQERSPSSSGSIGSKAAREDRPGSDSSHTPPLTAGFDAERDGNLPAMFSSLTVEMSSHLTVSGMLDFKVLSEQGGKKNRTSIFTRIYGSVQHGKFEIYNAGKSLLMSKREQLPRKTNPLIGRQGIHAKTECFLLTQCLANKVPQSGKGRANSFVLKRPDGSIFLFDACAGQSADKWITACNFWAAQISRASRFGSISNAEYGWGNCCEDLLKVRDKDRVKAAGDVTVQVWARPDSNMEPNLTSDDDHLEHLRNIMQFLQQELEQHNGRKEVVERAFPPSCSNRKKVVRNWENRSNHLLEELIRYRTYLDTLEKAHRDRKLK